MFIESFPTPAVTLERVTFTNNYGASTGGGMGARTGNVVLNDVTFSGNSASEGGAIGVDDSSHGGNWILNNVLITNNSAGLGGGIETTSQMTLTNVTLADNTAGSYGGGIVALAATTVRNSIIWGNRAPSWFNLCCDSSAGCVAPTLSYNDVESDCCNCGGTTNIQANPMLQPLGNYGGGIQTRALPPNSPVIDAGDPASTNCTINDERGEARDDLRCDMGAFEQKYVDGIFGVDPILRQFSGSDKLMPCGSECVCL